MMVSENQRAEVLETPYARQLTSGGGKPGQGYPLVHVRGGAQQDEFVGDLGIVGALAHSSNSHHGNHQPKYVAGSSVRRLTPTECERLQALPDDWTDFGPDSRRYAALGDAVTASVAEFLGRRLIRAETST